MTRAIGVMLAVLGIGLVCVPSAGATFPGLNGEMMYTSHDLAGRTILTKSDIQAHDFETSMRRNLLSCSWGFTDDDCLVIEGAASADGKRVAVIVHHGTAGFPGRDYRLTVVDPSSNEMTSIRLDGPAFDPAWSPSGDMLLVTRYDGPTGMREDGAPRVARLSTDGRELDAVTPRGASNADWAATGEIAFVLDGDIWVTRPGEPARQLTTAGGAAPSWSPDGKQLAFRRAGRIWTMRSDGGGQRQLTALEAHAPAWSPDGRYVIFSRPDASVQEGDGDIWLMSSEGRCPRLIRNGYSVEFYGDPFWRPLPVEGQRRRLPTACRYLRPDMRSAKRRVRPQGTSFWYRFRARPRIEGQAVFHMTTRISVPGHRGMSRRRIAVARAGFTAGPRGVVRLQPQLSRTARRALHANRDLRLTVVAWVRDDVGEWVRESVARKRLLLLAPQR